MLNEKQIEALKNGAYGVTRDGNKVRVISVFDELALVAVHKTSWKLEIYANFPSYSSSGLNSGFDIVGLWEDKPEPFNLERALAGEPVKLVNGKKAYVLKQLTNKYGDWLLGYIDYDTYQVVCDWGVTGGVDLTTYEENFSIAGMWKSGDE